MSQPGAKLRVGTLPQEERMAIIEGARKLGLNPYEFGGFLSLESGPNMDPNIVGGAGKKHKGLIQFGENEQKQYGIVGPQTRAGQMPAVLQYFKDRGFEPGMNIERAYATVLGGNPNVSLTAKDSFGTSVASASKRFKKGGDLYANAQRVLGDLPPPAPTLPAVPAVTSPNTNQRSVIDILSSTLGLQSKPDFDYKKTLADNLKDSFKKSIMEQMIPSLSGFQLPNFLGKFTPF